MKKNDFIKKVAKSTLPKIELPGIPDSFLKEAGAVQKFKESLIAVGGEVVSLAEGLNRIEGFRKKGKIFSSLTEFPSDITNSEQQNVNSLKDIFCSVIKGGLGVAENGAVWITDQDIPHRSIPFISQHLMVVLNQSAIVANMHQAYQKIDLNACFGVFISGPSKTADIEQSLVTGAHGPRSMIVVIQ